MISRVPQSQQIAAACSNVNNNNNSITTANIVNYIEEFVCRACLDAKVAIFKRLLYDYRRYHSIDTSDQEYYGIVLLDAIVSYTKECNIVVSKQFDKDDAAVSLLMHRCSKNDNLVLRMVAHFFAYLSLYQLEQFEVWCQPLDIVTCINK